MNASSRRSIPDVRTVAIVGVGLLGGSVAKTLKKLDSRIVCRGYARSSAAVARLQCIDWLDLVSDSLAAVCQSADVVVIAAPVDSIASLARRCADVTTAQTLITDVGSTKESIVSQTSDLTNFVASHPIAGSEKSGADAALDDLFNNKTTIITPSRNADAAMVDRCDNFWKMLGSQTIRMSPSDHDQRLAAVSHVPHLIAALVARSTPAAAAAFVGSGWRDITRVAAGDVAMWSAIVADNRDAIGQQLSAVRDDLDQLINSLNDISAVETFLESAKTIKDNIDS